MPRLYPFRGYRFDAGKVGSIGDVITQPYDKITPAMKQEYLDRNPRNLVRILLNPDYAEAGRLWREWIDEGTLVQEESPGFYLYRQQFSIDGVKESRTGLIGLLSLEEEPMRGHERVLDAPMADRIAMIEATEANEGLIFGLYSNPDTSLDQTLIEPTAQTPVCEFTDEFETRHQLWCWQGAHATEATTGAVADRSLYIADGHHRFETSCHYHRVCQQRGWRQAAPESFDKRMVALFNMESPGLRILATHRAVANLPDLDAGRLMEKLEEHFNIEKVRGPEQLPPGGSCGTQQIGLVTADPTAFYQLSLRDGVLQDTSFMPSVEGPARPLDVTLLHAGILESCLGLGQADVAGGKYVQYYRDRDVLIESVRQGRHQFAFLLEPTRLEQVRTLSDLGQRMPQKSTDFYPKLATGLVMMKMEIEK